MTAWTILDRLARTFAVTGHFVMYGYRQHHGDANIKVRHMPRLRLSQQRRVLQHRLRCASLQYDTPVLSARATTRGRSGADWDETFGSEEG